VKPDHVRVLFEKIGQLLLAQQRVSLSIRTSELALASGAR
jgi:hypothetical protein